MNPTPKPKPPIKPVPPVKSYEPPKWHPLRNHAGLINLRKSMTDTKEK